MGRNVEFGDIDVSHTRSTRAQPVSGPGGPIVNRRAADVPGSTQGRLAKARVAVSFRPDRCRRQPELLRLLEERRHTLPRRRVLMVVPSRELVDHTIPRTVVRGVPHDAVVTREHACG